MSAVSHVSHAESVLTVTDFDVRYGGSHVLRGLALEIRPNELVALLGRNGMGKTTLVHALMGMTRSSGSIRFQGVEVQGWPAHRIARAGMALVPQGRRIFPTLTVEENLRIVAQRPSERGWALADVYDLLPRLHERRRNRGNELSGGEQQMLAIGRGLISNPTLLLLDEPSEGLAPKVVEQIGSLLLELRGRDMSFLLVEQKVEFALGLADRAYVLNKGTIAFEGQPAELSANPALLEAHLGLGAVDQAVAYVSGDDPDSERAVKRSLEKGDAL